MPFRVSFLEGVALMACAINDAYEKGGFESPEASPAPPVVESFLIAGDAL